LETYCVASFPSVSHALRFEKLMISLQKPVKLIPVPRIISSSCGIAARFPQEELDEITALVASGAVEVEKVYLFTCEGKRTQVAACPGPWTEE
jgi:hypothetical protein